MTKKPSEKKQIRQFSVAMGVLLSLLATINLWKHGPAGHAWPYLYGAGGAFALVGLALPAVMRPVFRGWMKLAAGLAWVNTRLLLGIVYYGIFTPIGLAARLFRVDLMDQRFPGPARESYWVKRPPRAADPDQYERQF